MNDNNDFNTTQFFTPTIKRIEKEIVLVFLQKKVKKKYGLKIEDSDT